MLTWSATLATKASVLPSGLMMGKRSSRLMGNNVSRFRMPSKTIRVGSTFFGGRRAPRSADSAAGGF
jgi:hypothetical protein